MNHLIVGPESQDREMFLTVNYGSCVPTVEGLHVIDSVVEGPDGSLYVAMHPLPVGDEPPGGPVTATPPTNCWCGAPTRRDYRGSDNSRECTREPYSHNPFASLPVGDVPQPTPGEAVSLRCESCGYTRTVGRYYESGWPRCCRSPGPGPVTATEEAGE